MVVAVVAEKPAMAQDIAAVLGASRRRKGFLEGGGYVVTWAVGHLVGLAEPEGIRPAWRSWRRELLPMLPREWPLVVLPGAEEQFAVLREILHRPDVAKVVCATDAGREGELIFRYIYRLAGCTRPVERLWISSLTPAAIAQGFARLRPAADYDALAAAAEGRSRADWLVGMNFTRDLSLRHGPELLSVGRVQTPTLALLVERELAIQDFVPEQYRLLTATFGRQPGDSYTGVWFDPARVREEPGQDGPAAPEVAAASGTASASGSVPSSGTAAASGSPADDAPRAERLPPDGQLAEEIRRRCLGQPGVVIQCGGKQRSFPPPQLYDLTELQRHANRLFGFTAKTTLALAQTLYERHKAITYPRTDSRHLTTEVAGGLPALVALVGPRYPGLVASGSGERPLGRRFVDDAKVSDHHALLPTVHLPDPARLSRDEERLYDLICRRLLMAWHDDFRQLVTTVVTEVASSPEVADRFRSSGTVVLQHGWKVLDLQASSSKSTTKPARTRGRRRPATSAPDEEQDGGRQLPAGLAVGQSRPVVDVRVEAKETRPPRPFTDATLLTAMETAGKLLDSRELEEAMRERGLGTPATRAATIETLLGRGYLERQGKALRATPKGLALIARVHPSVKSPALTGEWELELRELERGRGTLAQFMERIEAYVIEVLGGPPPADPGPVTGDSRPPAPAPAPAPRPPAPAPAPRPPAPAPAPRPPAPAPAPRPPAPAPAPAPRPSSVPARPPAAGPTSTGQLSLAPPPVDLRALLRERFGLPGFRPHQEEVCQTLVEGRDALVVMPTGSGKSLCYQLPGIARGGTTVVVSPLIALMDDQAAKLSQLGFVAERIHSGRPREELRQACRLYLAGRLDFLLLAPERLSVPGFPELLARRPPALVAIDEAHCISHWGHDFRPDYRLLGERLPLLRPAPVVALTATATVRVQEDILQQLGLDRAGRFIRGFRRDNLAIEVLDVRPGQRPEEAAALLADPARRPAIVYVPTRKAAEQVAAELGSRFPAAPYHAGLDPQERSRTQEAFQAGRLAVVVATVAFGMGIDKADIRSVVHLGLPGSLEAYYQEIGRAGRDGLPARAFLLFSFVDRRLHESFFARDYPATSVLQGLRAKIPDAGLPREELLSRSGLPLETAEPALVKLYVHGGVSIDADDVVRPASTGWVAPYEAIRAHRAAQIEEAFQFAQGAGCRMVRLIRHFGDVDDTHPCGICDACAPASCEARRFRPPLPAERVRLQVLLQLIAGADGLAVGSLHKALSPDGAISRQQLELQLEALARAGLVRIADDRFAKEGREIHFRRVWYAAPPATSPGALLDGVLLEDAAPPPAKSVARTAKRAPARRQASPPPGARPPEPTPSRRRAAPAPAVAGGSPTEELFARLRAWRLARARRHRIPAFRILPDRTLHGLVEAWPRSEAELLAVPGIGARIVEKYGEELLELLRQ